jgi:hypothetical protein
MGHARASHCIHPDLPRGGNAAAQLNRVKDKRSTSGIKPAVAYAKANRNFSAMAASRHGDHAPFAVERGRNCGQSGTEDCESGPQTEGTQSIAQSWESSYMCCTARQFELMVRPVETLAPRASRFISCQAASNISSQ